MQNPYQNAAALVVDDNAPMRYLLASLLRAVGLQTVLDADNTVCALQKLRDHPIDVVLADLAMQPLDGIEFVRLLRRAADSPNPRVPVIMITAHAERGKVIAARDAGVDEFLAKPLCANVLVEKLHAAMFAPRPFLRSPAYVGPDRRRRRISWPGVERRRAWTRDL